MKETMAYLYPTYVKYKKYTLSDKYKLEYKTTRFQLYQLVDNELEKLDAKYKQCDKLLETVVECQKLMKDGEGEDESLLQDAEKERYREISRDFPLLLKSPPPLLNEINFKIDFESKLTELVPWEESELNQQIESELTFSNFTNVPIGQDPSPEKHILKWVEDSEHYGSETDKSERKEKSSIKSYGRLKAIKPNMSTPPSSEIISDRTVSQSIPSNFRRFQRGRVIQNIGRPVVAESTCSEVSIHSNYVNKEASEFLDIHDYCRIFDIDFSKQVPYHVLEIIDLQAIAEKGKLVKINKEPAVNAQPDPWSNGFDKENNCIIYANEIRRTGNNGTDRGSMALPIDAKLNYIDGKSNEYLVLERGNCRVQSFKTSRPGDNEELLEHFYLYTGDQKQGKQALVSNPQWLLACKYIGKVEHGINYSKDTSYEVDQYFIASFQADENKQNIKQFDEHFVKIKDFKTEARGAEIKGYAITVVLGNDRCSDTKLYHIMKVKGKNNWTWRFLQYRLTENNLIRGESMDIDFLTRINNVNDKSCITYMTSWSNQLYISDAGRHVVYLTDLDGRLRHLVGNREFVKSDSEGFFNSPGSIVVDSKGNFIVADSGNNRIQAFSKNGQFITVIDVGFIRRPAGLQLDDYSRLFMLSTKDAEVYAMKLSHQAENEQYERPMSKGSQNFFSKKKKDGRIQEGVNRGNTGYNRGINRGNRRGRGNYKEFNNPQNNFFE